MNKLKKYARISLIWLGVLLAYVFILTILNYTQILKFNSIIKLNFFMIAIITFIFGILNGKTSAKKGYIEGIKMGLIIIALLFILNLIFYRTFNLSTFIYYIVILASSMFGSMIGINLKKN